MKKIVFVSCSWMGYGADFSMISIIKKLKNEGIDSIVLIPRNGRVEDSFKKENIFYEVVPFKAWVSSRYIPLVSEIYAVYKYIYNIVLSKKVAKELTGDEIIGIYSNTYTDNFGIMLSKRVKKPYIQHIRELGKEDFKRHYDIGEKATNRIMSKSASKIVCISDCVLNKHKTKWNAKKIVRVYNGIPEPKKGKISKNNSEETIKFVMVGRIDKLKRQKLLLEACLKLNRRGICGYKVFFAGDGEESYMEELKKYAKTEKLNNVEFLGYKNNLDLSQYDIGVICSPSEAYGRVTAEYMSYGLSVIGANGGATPELIDDEETGLLFEVDNADDLASKMEIMIKNHGLSEKYGRTGYVKYRDNFSEEKYQENIYKIISSVFDTKEQL